MIKLKLPKFLRINNNVWEKSKDYPFNVKTKKPIKSNVTGQKTEVLKGEIKINW